MVYTWPMEALGTIPVVVVVAVIRTPCFFLAQTQMALKGLT